jgi:S-adenosylmethionine hydrolase
VKASFNTAILILFLLSTGICCRRNASVEPLPAIVLQSDFGVKDGAVAAMKGVIRGVDPKLDIFDLTHEIPVFNTWEAAYRLEQSASYWPAGTVFVSVVDPGVGTARRSLVLKTKTGHYFVSPDNGSLGLVAASMGILEVREIDEATNRRASSGASYTFHGRDVYAHTAAKLASGRIQLGQVGKRLADTVVTIPYQRAVLEAGTLRGMIPVLDIQYGNVWTNIPDSLLKRAGFGYGDSLRVRILHKGKEHFSEKILLVHTFGEVSKGSPMAYVNSLMQVSIALNQVSFAQKYQVASGPDWTVEINR